MVAKNIQENKKVPKLRFNGFDGEWEEERLGSLAIFLKGRGISKDDIYEDGKNKCIRYGELYTTYNEIIRDVKSRTNIPVSDSLLSIKNDLLIPSSGETALEIATVSLVHEDNILLGGDLNVIRLKEKQDGGFFAYYLSNFKNKDIARLSQGYTVAHLYSSSLKDLKINPPIFDEQQKIASFLGAIDEWAENLKEQKENLELYKKGMMQKIFSQEIRFKDINTLSFNKWQEIKLGDLFKERIERNEGQKIDLLSITLEEGVSRQDSSIKRDSSSSDKSNYKIVHVGDIAYNTMRMWQGAFGVSKYFGITSPAYTIVFLKSGCIDFFGYLFKCTRTIFDFYRYSQGLTSDTWNLKYYHFSKVTARIPIEIKEQQKITDFLTSLDKGIESKQQQISQAEQWKKGLMQRLFI